MFGEFFIFLGIVAGIAGVLLAEEMNGLVGSQCFFEWILL
jgi:hypothetical protein